MKRPLIVIAGPTAAGKSEAAVYLAKALNGNIISADSMQVYKYMDIGTAKPTKEEMKDIPHYLIDEIYPDEDFSIAVFKEKATEYLNQTYLDNKFPILTGGTGFYINAAIRDNRFTETNRDDDYRNELYMLAERCGNEYVFDMLKKIDTESSLHIHPNNIKRVIRALEFYKQTNTLISSHNREEKSRQSPFHVVLIVLYYERDVLYERIHKRVDLMIEKGLAEEVRCLLDKGYGKHLVSMQGIGYKEMVKYLDGEISLNAAADLIKKNTRHFAKRQLTWFKRQSDGLWFDMANTSFEILYKTIKNQL